VGAFEIDWPSSSGTIQLSSPSREAPCTEEHMDSEGIIRRYTASYPSSLHRCRTGDAAGICLADQFSIGVPESDGPSGKKASRLSSRVNVTSSPWE
jgi:hypothetical protein